MMSRIRVLSFDLDDTLWDNRPVLERAEQTLFAYLCEQCEGFAEYFSIASLTQLKDNLALQHPEFKHQISEIRIVTLEKALQQAAFKGNCQALAEEAFSQFLQARHNVCYWPEVEQTLRQLANTYTLAALTNGNADISRLSINRYFSYSLRAEELNISKPDPRFYQHALAKLDVEPQSLLHVGDHPRHDIEGARQLGIRTVWMDNGYTSWPGELPTPSLQITRISQLKTLLEEE